MATVNEELRNELLGIAELFAIVGDKIFEHDVPQVDEKTGEPDCPFVWFAQGRMERNRCTDDGPETPIFLIEFDIELVSFDVGECVQMANIVRIKLDKPMRTTLGGIPAKAVLVEDQSDAYIARNKAADSGVSVASLSVSIYPA